MKHRLGVRGRDQTLTSDMYDFEAGQPGGFPALTLEEAGRAKRLAMISESRRQNVTARVRVQPNGRLVLEGEPSWGPIQSP